MTENQRRALQVAEETFRRYSDHHAIKGDETKARANMALAGQMSAALAEPDHKLIYQGGGKELFQKLWLLTHNCVTSHAGNVVHTDKLPMQEMRAFLNHLCCLVDSPPAELPQLTEAEIGNLWHQHMTKLPHEASAAEFIAGVRAGASAVRQKAGLA